MSSTLPRHTGVRPSPPSTDERLAALASERLQHSSHLDLLRLTCTCHDGVVAIHGRVPSYYLKQLAQTLVQQVDQVHEIENCLVVTSPRRSRP